VTGRIWLDAILGFAAAMLLSWLALVIALAIRRPKGDLLKESLRLLPDLLRLLRRLTTNRDLPTGVRVRVALLFVYLAIPIDVIPDFIPILGYADDAIVVILILRSVCRRISVEELRAAWAGSDDGFAALCQLVRPTALARDHRLPDLPRATSQTVDGAAELTRGPKTAQAPRDHDHQEHHESPPVSSTLTRSIPPPLATRLLCHRSDNGREWLRLDP
jgi:uncharacterized membrane protein YkvA (DUF1232 family)